LFYMVKKYLINFYRSLSFKLFLILLSMVVAFVILYSTLCAKLHQNIVEDTVRMSAYRISNIMKQSLHRLMLSNKRDELSRTIEIIGNEPGIERIRIYNKKGEIKFSTNENEIEQIMDMRAEACSDCHLADKTLKSLPLMKKTHIYRATDGRRILGMINPIRNSPECSNAACHIHPPDHTVLGVLDVQMSLSELDEAIHRAKSFIFVVIVFFIFIGTVVIALIIYFIVHRPVSILENGTAKLANGNLEYRIQLNRNDELGTLATSINNMALNLKQANRKLRDWSELLEKRVEEKTAELEQMHKEILQVEKMASLGKMAASVAHELNNPLAGIITYAKLLINKIKEKYQNDSEKKRYLEKLEFIRSEAMRCGNIVKNLLVFARGSTPNFQNCILSDIIERALKIVNHHTELAHIEVKKNINIQPGTIICDPDQLLQAFVALLINAVEAMPNGGLLEVTVQNSQEDDNWVIITIRDTGVGIPDDVKDKILEPFFTTKKEKNGVGLGLSVVYGIIQHHKGKIWLESQKGEGTTFYIKLPVVQQNTDIKETNSGSNFQIS